jgi:hypothetical protein
MTNLSKSSQWFNKIRSAEIKRRGGKCQNKGCTQSDPKKLQMAHLVETAISKIRRGRGSNARAIDWLRHPEAYALLCENEHTLFDHHEYVIEINGVKYQKVHTQEVSIPCK